MGKWIWTIGLALSLVSAAFAASWETSSMRSPKGGLIQIGMPAHEVLKELGQPLGAHARTRHASGKTGKGKEKWSYRGTDGLYTLTLSGGKVVRILVTPDRDWP
jgi:hypothetical protein